MTQTNTALLFTGQGSQEASMGRTLAEQNPEVMGLWKRAEKISKIDLRGIYWDGGEGINDTRNVQPALTVFNIALWLQYASTVKPTATAGHSLGEYSALAAAAVLDIDTILQLVTLRGALMAEADPSGKGAMAAILKLDQSGAEALVQEVQSELAEPDNTALRIANYNTPAQFVASGSKTAIALLVEKAKERKARALPLAVSGAFHTPMMADAAKELASAINNCKFADPRFPLYCNANGKASHTGEEIKKLLLQQMTSSVFWIDTISNMYKSGVNSFIECGPKNVLAKMTGQILATQAEADTYNAALITE